MSNPVTPSPTKLRRNRFVIVLIAMISFVPFAIAWYMAKHPELVRDRERVNRGNLIDPARPQDYADLMQSPVTPAETLPEIKGHWVMVLVAPAGTCGPDCRDLVHKSGQIRLMLNKEISRVRRLLLVAAPADRAQLQETMAADPTLLVAEMNDKLGQQLREAAGSAMTDGMLLLMDPFANVMMWYPAGFDPYDVLKDLQRLLRISQIG
jgi:hypothetical protein